MKFSIGEFSKMTSLTIKSLRLYHEKGILKPAEVDKFTGYRYYNDTNYEIARSIKIMKDLDFTLAEIREIFDYCEDESDMLEFLQKKSEEVTGKIHRYKKVSHAIELNIQFVRESSMSKTIEFEIEEKTIDTKLIAGYRMKGKYEEVGKGFGMLGKKMGRHINGKAMTLYYDGEYKEADADFEACFPVRKGSDSDGISVRELKGGNCVTLIHKGPYQSLGDSYKKIYEYIKEKNYKKKIPSREVYLKGPGMIFKGNPKNYLTEIQIFIDEEKSQ
ncbi:GyrI-like domain-containing protein [candidate division KSB1 bacterium]|nr:GyrI-like domain-containing protein [candidate division KSB1 bacterium]